MKKKSFKKKLVLKKGIISNLNMSNVKGGNMYLGSNVDDGCETDEPNCNTASCIGGLC